MAVRGPGSGLAVALSGRLEIPRLFMTYVKTSNIYHPMGLLSARRPRLSVRCLVLGSLGCWGRTRGVSARLAHQFHHLGHHLRVLLEEGVELVLVLHERLQLLLGHTDDGRAVRAVTSSSRWQGRLATAG